MADLTVGRITFTPGPWVVADSWETWPHYRGVRERSVIVLPSDPGEPSICHVAQVPPENEAEQARELANARLIAAAPDLLAALKGVMSTIADHELCCCAFGAEMVEQHQPFCAEARAAIAKAEGR